MENVATDPQPVLSVGSRLTSGAMFSSPGPRRKYSEAGLGVSPFIHFDSAKIGRGDKNKKKKQEKDKGKGGIGKSIAFGLINGGVMIPTMVGFTSIIYKDAFFVENGYLPQANKLVFLSSAIHQLCFAMFSTLPFAVGQVQDAGLIFLSSMAVQIVANMEEFHSEEPNTHKVMTTTVVVLSLCTALLGCMLVVTGKLKLARLVQYLPLPVVGGYLAFIGLFCGLSGLHLMTGAIFNDVLDLKNLFTPKNLKLVGPGFAATAVLFLISKKAKENQYALPMAMIAMPALFFVILLVTGSSMEDAREAGWVAPTSDLPQFYEVFKLFEFSKVDWGAAFPSVLPTFFAMFAVVAFGSSLDVAAIQFELGTQMDYDEELVTVGMSNAVSGLTGGYTGSYIFSQTIFTLRNGINSRICGLVVASVELALFLLPIDLMSLLPRFFFGSVLMFVAIDLLLEWLVFSWFLIEWKEYILVWLTFLFVNLWGLEAGMALGVVCSALQFVYSYSGTTSVELIPNSSSRAVRSYFDRKLLSKYSGRIVALRLNGYHFFGTVIRTIMDIQSHVVVPMEDETASPASTTAEDFGLRMAQQRAQALQQEIQDDGATESGQASGQSPPGTRQVSTRLSRSMSQGGAVAGELFASSGASPKKKKKLTKMSQASQSTQKKNKSPQTRPAAHSQSSVSTEVSLSNSARQDGEMVETRFLVLDFSYSSYIDATAARACFLTVLQSLNHRNIRLVLTGLSDDMRSVLRKNDVLKPNRRGQVHDEYSRLEDLEAVGEDGEDEYALEFPTLDEGLQFCEENLLGAMIRKQAHPEEHGFFSSSILREVKSKYFEDRVVEKGTVLFRKGQPATELFVVDSGRVDRVDSMRQFSGGSIFGIDDFFLHCPYSYTAKAARQSRVNCLTKDAYKRMLEDDPALAVHLQHTLIKQMIRSGQ